MLGIRSRFAIMTSAAALFVSGGAVAGGLDAGATGIAAMRPASTCAACHGAIQKAWAGSVKSRSWTNPVFRAGLADARAARGDAIVHTCLSCHAPLASAGPGRVVTDSEDDRVGPAHPIGAEGITCNFCHNVASVEVSPKPASYTLDASDPKLMRGPFADASPGSAHGAAFADVFTKSDFCASCHWAQNDKGIAFETSYPEWNDSAAGAAGRSCQDCHMPPAPGKASPLARKSRPAVYAHTFVGPRTAGGLDSVAALTASVEAGKLRIAVRNLRAGHALPGGGHSFRAMTLEAIYYDAAGKELSRGAVATYGTEFADEAGKGPVPKWLAASVLRSRTIPADSEVVERTSIPSGARRVAAVLTYQPLAPSIRARLQKAGADLTGRDPVVMARTELNLP